MNHQRKLAAALACALCVSLCGAHVLADGSADAGERVDAPLIIAPAPQPAPSAPESEVQTPAADGAFSDSRPGFQAGTPRARKSFIVEDTPVPAGDPDGTVSFYNLGPRMMKSNLNILALDENIEAIEAVDYKEMKKGLQTAITMISAQQEQLAQLVDGTAAALDGLNGVLAEQNLGIDLSVFRPSLVAYPQATIATLETQLASYRDTLKQLENGQIEEQYDRVIRQLKNAQRQIVKGGETLYLTLLGLEQTREGLQRNLDSLDRTLAELDVRYEMGQISALTLAEAKAGRTSLVSGMTTLEMNITALRRQLEGMLGEEITGTIQLQPLTAVTDDELSCVDAKTDLEHVMAHSYDLKSAKDAYSDAADSYKALKNSPTAPDYEVDAAFYNRSAADLTVEATEQSIELSFLTLCDQLLNQQQVLAAARTSHAVKQDNYAAAQLKYEQGTISYNTLMTALDALNEAADTVDTAAIDLFTYYNNYCWAVEHGILN